LVGLVAWVRSDVGQVRTEVGEAEERLGSRIDQVEERFGQGLTQLEERLGKRIDQVEERLGKRIDTLATDEAALARSVAWMQGAFGVRPGERVIFGRSGGERAGELTPDPEASLDAPERQRGSEGT